jgi:hypothetical protein
MGALSRQHSTANGVVPGPGACPGPDRGMVAKSVDYCPKRCPGEVFGDLSGSVCDLSHWFNVNYRVAANSPDHGCPSQKSLAAQSTSEPEQPRGYRSRNNPPVRHHLNRRVRPICCYCCLQKRL